MIKLIKIIFFLFFSFYSAFFTTANAKEKIKIGLLVPMTGANKEIGESIIKAVGLAIKDIDNNLIEIYPKDTATKANQTLKSAFELSQMGVKVVIAESFERIHRSNLIGMGILPLQFINNINRKNLKLKGSELISIINLEKGVSPSDQVEIEIKYASGDIKKISTLCRIDIP